MPDQSPQNTQTGEISLKDLIMEMQEWYRYLRSRWVVILIACIIGGTLGLAYSLYEKPIYTATLTFALEEKGQSSSFGGYAGLASQFGIDLGGGSNGAFSGDNIMELMKSRLMVSKTLLSSVNINGVEQSLADFYIGFNKYQVAWRKGGPLRNLSFPGNGNVDSLSFVQDSIMGIFYKDIIKDNLTVVKGDKNVGIITVKCKSGNDLFSKYFIENLVRNVTTLYVTTKTNRSATNVDILQNRLDSVKQAFNSMLYGTASVTDQNLNPARAIVSVPRLRGEANAKILGTELGELTKNLEIAKLALLQETPLIQIIDRPILPLEKDKPGKLKSMIVGILLGFILSILTLIIRSSLKTILTS